MAYVVDKFSPEITLDSVPVVREFSNVLFEDSLGLLLDRESKFENRTIARFNSYLGIIIHIGANRVKRIENSIT